MARKWTFWGGCEKGAKEMLKRGFMREKGVRKGGAKRGFMREKGVQNRFSREKGCEKGVFRAKGERQPVRT